MGIWKRLFPNAMAFYHEDGLPAAWQQAIKFAGPGGRIATMPDIVAARLGTKPGDAPWETYYATLSAEYYGFNKQGNLILIIAHGVGPMSTLDGICKAYSWEYKDHQRNRRGGRITQQEFWDLESGKFGAVEVVEYEPYCRRYQYPFIQTLHSSEAMTDPVLKARFGPQAEQYVAAHTAYARKWHREQAGFNPENECKLPDDSHQRYLSRRMRQHVRDMAENSDPYIIQVEDAANCAYLGIDCRIPEKGYAFAHLISTGRLCNLHHEGNESLVLDVSCHEWWNGVRLVGIKAGGSIISGIHAGPDARALLRKHWRELMVPIFPPDINLVGFCALMKIGSQWFTQYPKQGEAMDTWEPEFAVVSTKKIGQPVLFRTTVGGGYYGFFRFGINEVKAYAPPGANAYYFVGEPQIESRDGNPEYHTAMVQFYLIGADTTLRLIRSDKLCHDYDTMMRLLNKSK